MRPLILAVVLVVLTACADNPPGDTPSGIMRRAAVRKAGTTQQTLASFSSLLKRTDTLFINEKVAVFINPDSSRIEKQKKEGSEEDFYITANDYLYYMGTAREFLDSVKVRVIDVENEKVIKFVSSTKQRQLITISKQPELWSIYFFDPAKKAKQVDMTVIEEEYEAYFK